MHAMSVLLVWINAIMQSVRQHYSRNSASTVIPDGLTQGTHCAQGVLGVISAVKQPRR